MERWLICPECHGERSSAVCPCCHGRRVVTEAEVVEYGKRVTDHLVKPIGD